MKRLLIGAALAVGVIALINFGAQYVCGKSDDPNERRKLLAKEANQLHSEKRYAEALSILNVVIGENPNNAKLLVRYIL